MLLKGKPDRSVAGLERSMAADKRVRQFWCSFLARCHEHPSAQMHSQCSNSREKMQVKKDLLDGLVQALYVAAGTGQGTEESAD